MWNVGSELYRDGKILAKGGRPSFGEGGEGSRELGVDGNGEVGMEGAYILGGGVGRAERGGEAKKSAVRERLES